MMLKRVFDLVVSVLSLLFLAPLMLLIALWVKVGSKGPVLFRQVRVGQHGKLFRIFKYRTMHVEAEQQGPQITIGVDSRITSQGHFLRKFKLDEVPQLLNVLLGDMSLVGPRPEVPKYMATYPEDIRALVLSVKPGVTDLASIKYKDESATLAKSSDPEHTYIHQVLPSKQRYYVEYVKGRTFAGDLSIIFSTVKAIFFDRD